MVTEEQILEKLDNYKMGNYCQFINLGHVYSYLIDCRLNIFTDNVNNWAVVAERLGCNPRAGGIMLDIIYFGNCLRNVETYNGDKTNYYTVYPIDWNSFDDSENGDILKVETQFWTIRGEQIRLSHEKQDYINAGIELKEIRPGEISLEEAGRLTVLSQRNLLRATDAELYKSIPPGLQKILVLDEWYHRDFNELSEEIMSDEQLLAVYNFNKNLSPDDFPIDYESFVALIRQSEKSTNKYNQEHLRDNRPSSYETWKLLAKVIATGDPSFYKPTLKPNTHWRNWPESGSM